MDKQTQEKQTSSECKSESTVREAESGKDNLQGKPPHTHTKESNYITVIRPEHTTHINIDTRISPSHTASSEYTALDRWLQESGKTQHWDAIQSIGGQIGDKESSKQPMVSGSQAELSKL